MTVRCPDTDVRLRGLVKERDGKQEGDPGRSYQADPT